MELSIWLLTFDELVTYTPYQYKLELSITAPSFFFLYSPYQHKLELSITAPSFFLYYIFFWIFGYKMVQFWSLARARYVRPLLVRPQSYVYIASSSVNIATILYWDATACSCTAYRRAPALGKCQTHSQGYDSLRSTPDKQSDVPISLALLTIKPAASTHPSRTPPPALFSAAASSVCTKHHRH